MRCSRDKILNPDSGRCVLKTGRIGRLLLGTCPKDKIMNPNSGRCVIKTGKIGTELSESDSIFKGIRKSCKDVGWVKKREIGSGGYGTVYVACKGNKCSYVLKIQPITRAYYNEVKFLKELEKYKFVPTIYDSWTCRGKGYIIMERLYTRSSLIKEEKHNKLLTIIKILHKKNIVYFDIHKGNIMYKDNQVYLIDYGLMRKFKNRKTEITHLHSRDYGKFNYSKGVKLDYLNIDEYFGNEVEKRTAKKELKKMMK